MNEFGPQPGGVDLLDRPPTHEDRAEATVVPELDRDDPLAGGPGALGEPGEPALDPAEAEPIDSQNYYFDPNLRDMVPVNADEKLDVRREPFKESMAGQDLTHHDEAMEAIAAGESEFAIAIKGIEGHTDTTERYLVMKYVVAGQTSDGQKIIRLEATNEDRPIQASAEEEDDPDNLQSAVFNDSDYGDSDYDMPSTQAQSEATHGDSLPPQPPATTFTRVESTPASSEPTETIVATAKTTPEPQTAATPIPPIPSPAKIAQSFELTTAMTLPLPNSPNAAAVFEPRPSVYEYWNPVMERESPADRTEPTSYINIGDSLTESIPAPAASAATVEHRSALRAASDLPPKPPETPPQAPTPALRPQSPFTQPTRRATPIEASIRTEPQPLAPKPPDQATPSTKPPELRSTEPALFAHETPVQVAPTPRAATSPESPPTPPAEPTDDGGFEAWPVAVAGEDSVVMSTEPTAGAEPTLTSPVAQEVTAVATVATEPVHVVDAPTIQNVEQTQILADPTDETITERISIGSIDNAEAEIEAVAPSDTTAEPLIALVEATTEVAIAPDPTKLEDLITQPAVADVEINIDTAGAAIATVEAPAIQPAITQQTFEPDEESTMMVEPMQLIDTPVVSEPIVEIEAADIDTAIATPAVAIDQHDKSSAAAVNHGTTPVAVVSNQLAAPEISMDKPTPATQPTIKRPNPVQPAHWSTEANFGAPSLGAAPGAAAQPEAADNFIITFEPGPARRQPARAKTTQRATV